MDIRTINLRQRHTHGTVEKVIRMMGRLIKIERHRYCCLYKLSALLILLSVDGSYQSENSTLLKILIIVLCNKYFSPNNDNIDLALQGLTSEELNEKKNP